jgi:hypothetical protein
MDTLTTLISLIAGLESTLRVLRAEASGLDFPSLREHIGPKAATGLRKQLNRLAAEVVRAGVDFPLPATLHGFVTYANEGEACLPDADDAHLFVCALLIASRRELNARRWELREESYRELAALNAA